jgi:hypothetical protein
VVIVALGFIQFQVGVIPADAAKNSDAKLTHAFMESFSPVLSHEDNMISDVICDLRLFSKLHEYILVRPSGNSPAAQALLRGLTASVSPVEYNKNRLKLAYFLYIIIGLIIPQFLQAFELPDLL